MRNPATLKKISDHLSISISTVSRALKDHQDVSPDTKRRVKELAEMLDYEPNSFAVNLRKQHSDLFAVMVPQISNFFYHSFIEAVEIQARSIGYSLMILQSMNDTEVERNNLKLCRYNHVAGVFVALSSTTENIDAFRKMEEWDIPVVFFDMVPEEGVFNRVVLSDYEIGRLAAEKMRQSGRKKIFALMGQPHLSITHRREKGIREYISDSDWDTELEITYTKSELDAMEQTITYMQNNRVGTAIFSMSDETLCGAIRALNQLHLSFPTDVSLLTVSNGFLPKLFSPEIAYIETNGKKLGMLTFERMKEILSGVTSVKDSYLDCSYYEGGSL
jgi:LacI family transcriptional regulator